MGLRFKSPKGTNTIVFKFKTTDEDGIILFNKGSKEELFAVELFKGALHVKVCKNIFLDVLVSMLVQLSYLIFFFFVFFMILLLLLLLCVFFILLLVVLALFGAPVILLRQILLGRA